MASASKYHHQIKQLGVLAKLDDASLDRTIENASSVDFKRDAVVFHQDNPAHSLYVLLHGRLKVT